MPFTIFFIEDDLPTIDVYRDIFQKTGFEVEIIDSGQRGLEILKEVKENRRKCPDLILLDLILPDINGIEILRNAKSEPSLEKVPFIIFTNYTDPDLEHEIRRLGVEEYIVKTNYTPSKLISMIRGKFKGAT